MAAWPGSKRGEVEHRADFDEAAQFVGGAAGCPRPWPARKSWPGGPPAHCRACRRPFADGRVRSSSFSLSGFTPISTSSSTSDQPAQARIAVEITDQRCRLATEPANVRSQLILGFEQQAMAREELGAAGIGHALKVALVLRQRLRSMPSSPRRSVRASAPPPRPRSARTGGRRFQTRPRVGARRRSGDSEPMSELIAKWVAV